MPSDGADIAVVIAAMPGMTERLRERNRHFTSTDPGGTFLSIRNTTSCVCVPEFYPSAGVAADGVGSHDFSLEKAPIGV